MARQSEPGPGRELSTAGEDEGLAPKSKPSKQPPRKRVSQACDRCRSRKDKCDGKKPACSTCTSNGRTCSYDANVKKRGLPEGYVRGLEKLWGLAIRDVNEIEENMLDALNGDEESDNSPARTWSDETNSENLVNIWRKSQLSRELERVLSSVEPVSESSKRKRLDSDVQGTKKTGMGAAASLMSNSQHIIEDRTDPNLGWAEKQFDMKAPSEVIEPSNLPDIATSGHHELKDSNSILTPSYYHGGVTGGTPASSHELPDLPSETWHLLDVYFNYTHIWLPIIEKHDLLRTSYQYSQSHNTTSASGDQAALWAAIAYSKFQHRAINNIPRALGALKDMVWTAERMYAQARALVPNEEGTLELGHVQALLILALANIGMGHLSRAWSLVGQAVRAAVDLGLDKVQDPVSSRPRSRAKHVFLGCFVLDTIIAARLSRRPHLRAEDVEAVGSIDEDGLEEWDPWNDCLSVRRGSSGASRIPASILSTFNRLVQVLQILNEAVCAPRRGSTLKLSTSLLEKLHIWSQRQSPPLYFDSFAMRSEQVAPLLPHHYHLHTTYFTTLATSQLLSHNFSQDGVNLEPCTRSARQISELIKQHSTNFGLLIVPPTYEFFIKSAYDIVNEVQGSIDNTHIALNDWKHNLDVCLDAMEPAWSVFDALRDSVSYRSPRQGRRESEVAFDLISGVNQTVDTPISAQTPQSIASFETGGAYSPHIFMSQGNTQRPRTMSHTTKAVPPRSSQRTQSFGRTSGPGLPLPPSIYQDSRSVINRSNTITSQVSSRNIEGGLTGNYTPLDQSQLLDTQIQNTMSTASDTETDPLSNEFAALDAMEWTGNWDQSLLNLGFTDRGNMNQDFYAFCQEPDPLHPNNVFQQLVASSNAEATNFFGGSGLNSMGLNGYGMVSGDEHEGIEAGQILQALSAAEDQRTSGRVNM
ncbi:hypothetical protein G7Y89_g2103 [Cudoniella acicularis]|uniref:Zn(2)-C6 fungal-type domain-containing protein n=1 Tax=Cudoniella acicularis TaxID=354080 RepID=A0A8H4RV34_9HELO|nr:hypothetical protein G7Y89_g2103 [Cudoniella acicularis]